MVKRLFIVGVGRSGTSLLQSMFASNSSVCFLPETSFIRRYLSNSKLYQIFKKGGLNSISQFLRNDSHLTRIDSSLDKVLLGFEQNSFFSVSSLYLQLTEQTCRDETKWIGDKDPRLIEFLPLVSALASEGVVINVIRDPRDVLLSKKKASWSKNGHVWKHIFANRVQLLLGLENGPSFFGMNYHEVIYEELIAEPESILSALCIDIGLSYDSSMLDFGQAATKLVSDSEISWKKETFGPLLVSNKDKWRTGLSSREVFLTELCCRQAFMKGGYQLDSPSESLSLIDWLWIVTGVSAIFLFEYPYRLYRNYIVKRACKKIT